MAATVAIIIAVFISITIYEAKSFPFFPVTKFENSYQNATPYPVGPTGTIQVFQSVREQRQMACIIPKSLRSAAQVRGSI